MRSVTITRRCGLKLLEDTPDEKGKAIYVDPPYLAKGAEYEHDFTQLDHVWLASILQKFEKTRVVVSYYAHPDLDNLYPRDRWTRIDCTRAKHLSVQGRRGAESKKAPEILLVNQEPLLSGADNNGLFSEGESA